MHHKKLYKNKKLLKKKKLYNNKERLLVIYKT